MSPTLMAQGRINPDGTYQVGTDKATDGLPPDEYKVYLIGTNEIQFVEYKIPGQTDPGRREIRTPVIDKKYESADTSELTFTVDGKTRTFDITVERPAK